jgi:hypothetical protein
MNILLEVANSRDSLIMLRIGGRITLGTDTESL